MTHRWGGWSCGAVATVGCCALLVSGGFAGLDNYAFDLHSRYFSTIDADERIVLIDIDDGSLEAVGDWPWPRRRHAEIVRALDELGADQIALDLVFSDPSPPRVDDVLVDEVVTRDSVIYDDQELRDAIARAGNVQLAMYGQLFDTHADLGTKETNGVSGEGAGAERVAARRSAAEFLETSPGGSWREFLAFVGDNESPDAISPERLILRRAHRWAAARMETLAKTGAGKFGDDAPRFDVVGPVFPLASLVRAAEAVGFVAYLRDATDGVVREVPAVVGSSDQRYAQFAFAIASRLSPLPVAARMFGKTISVEGIDVPVDEDGLTLIGWHVARGSRDWRDSFTHIPAARLLEIEDTRAAIADNQRRLGIALAKLVEARFRDTPTEYARYAQTVNALLDARRRLDAAEPADREKLATKTAALKKSTEAVERDAMLWLTHAWNLWKGVKSKSEAERSQRATVAKLYAEFGHDELATDLAEKNKRLNHRIRGLVQELGPQIDGKICLVGYTASAQGDLVATPVHPAMPGVMVHANIVNMLLAGRVPAPAPLWWNLTMLAIVGAVVTFASGAKGWETGVAATAVVGGLVAAVGAAFFATRSVHLATGPAIATAFATWAVVTTWRQSTAEHTRRNLTRALTQYASPAVATRIAREMDVTDLAPESATVTCFFCDLVGFTAMSEKLGPRRTRDILNPYLAATSEELVARGALVNKFIGDGVFAFFNAPILRCEDHATRACEAALSIRRDVAQLDGGGGDGLMVRVGVATGEAFVGDYGSGVKLDYTCIGDTVNVGSRLERTGKALGASILVDIATRDAAGAGFVFRSMGMLRVRGRQAPVEAFELLDPACDEHTSRIASIERFTEAVRCFQCCQWDSCLAILSELGDRDEGDTAVCAYRRAAVALRDGGVSQDSGGALDVGSI